VDGPVFAVSGEALPVGGDEGSVVLVGEFESVGGVAGDLEEFAVEQVVASDA
jgi:hypothetical protein